MALISRKQETGEPPGTEDEADRVARVEVTIAGPDAERLGSLIDTSVLADLLKRRATAAEPPGDQ